MSRTPIRGTRDFGSTPAVESSFALNAEYDWVAVDLCIRGELNQTKLRPADRAEVVRRLNRQGLNDGEIQRQTGINARTILRIRHRLEIASVSEFGVNGRALVR